MLLFQRVAALVDPCSETGRSILQGIQRYARPDQQWFIFRDRAAIDSLDWPENHQPVGIIAHTTDPTLIQALAKTKLPVVNTAATVSRVSLPTVALNSYESGRAAAEHLIEAGFAQFAFVALRDHYDTQRKQAGFADRLRESNFKPQVHIAETSGKTTSRTKQPKHRLELLDGVRKWLIRMEKPVAVFAADDRLAEDLSEICRELDMDIPTEVGILGCDNDEFITQSCFPEASSVVVPAERVGYEAARLLHRLMEGEQAPRQAMLLAPLGVARRASTDLRVTDDPYVNAALSFIRENASQPINVGDVLRQVRISRRSLEQRFRAALGRTPLSEINRVRLDNAKALLSDSDMRVKDVAEATGFSSSEQLSAIFRKQVEMTPSAYRDMFQNQSAE